MLFTKMHGTGNDFIVYDNTKTKYTLDKLTSLAKKICQRRFCIGADGMLVINAPNYGGDYQMIIINSDGSVAKMCGNGARCMVKYAYEQGVAGTFQRIEVESGFVHGWYISKDQTKIQLNSPTNTLEIMTTPQVSYTEIGDPGVPHALLYDEDTSHWINGEKIPENIRELAATVRNQNIFKNGTNVSFYNQNKDGSINLLTYEKGVEDFTMSCGTGAGAAAWLVFQKRGIFQKQESFDYTIPIYTKGGKLYVTIQKDVLYLSGMIREVYKGQLNDI